MWTDHLRRAFLVMLGVVLAAAGVACGSSGSSKKSSPSTGQRPTTTARLEITAPQPNAKTGADITLKMNLIGGQVVPPETVSGPLRGDQGHIHVSVDGQLVSMNYGLEAPLTGLKPGSHSVQAEFVAVDHAPFKNRVIAAVLFEVTS